MRGESFSHPNNSDQEWQGNGTTVTSRESTMDHNIDFANELFILRKKKSIKHTLIDTTR